MTGNFPRVLNLNRSFFKLNRSICNQRSVPPFIACYLTRYIPHSCGQGYNGYTTFHQSDSREMKSRGILGCQSVLHKFQATGWDGMGSEGIRRPAPNESHLGWFECLDLSLDSLVAGGR